MRGEVSSGQRAAGEVGSGRLAEAAAVVVLLPVGTLEDDVAHAFDQAAAHRLTLVEKELPLLRYAEIGGSSAEVGRGGGRSWQIG